MPNFCVDSSFQSSFILHNGLLIFVNGNLSQGFMNLMITHERGLSTASQLHDQRVILKFFKAQSLSVICKVDSFSFKILKIAKTRQTRFFFQAGFFQKINPLIQMLIMVDGGLAILALNPALRVINTRCYYLQPVLKQKSKQQCVLTKETNFCPNLQINRLYCYVRILIPIAAVLVA